jgi:hypothetical protein
MTEIHTELQADGSWVVELMGTKAHPKQQHRELLVNAIEAVVRARKRKLKTTRDTAVSITEVDRGGVGKLAFIDLGDGMTPSQLESLLGTAGMSGGANRSRTGNFGVGAKITAIQYNPTGVEYTTLAPGAKHATRGVLAMDQDGKKGWMRLANGTSFEHVSLKELRRDAPQIARAGHGTMVVLHGQRSAHRTALGPVEGRSEPSKWLTAYYNTRFFTLPPHIQVSVIEPASDRAKIHHRSRRIEGWAELLDRTKAASGVVKLTGASVRWFILDRDKVSVLKDTARLHTTVATLIPTGEVYDLWQGPSGVHKLHQFGITTAHSKVALFVCPDSYTIDPDRTGLVIDDAVLRAWGDEFADKLPPALERMMEEALSSGESTKRYFTDTLQRFADLLSVSKFKRVADGTVDPDEVQQGATTTIRGSTRKDRKGRKPGTPAERTPPSGKRLKESAGESSDARLPGVEWLDIDHGVFAGGDRTMPAIYIEGADKLYLNRQFPPFVDERNHWAKVYGAERGASRRQCDEVLDAAFAHRIGEAVRRIQSLYGPSAQTYLSPAALVAAAMPMSVGSQNISSVLNKKIGRQKR